MKNLYDLLTGRDASQNFLAERFASHAGNKIFGHLEMHVGFQKSHSELTQRVSDILLRDSPVAAEVFEDVLKFIREPGKHINSMR